MGLYDHKQSILRLSGYEISAWTDAGDSLSIAESDDLGAYTRGIGRGIFVASGKDGGILTMKLLQHSNDNRFLSILRNQQKNNIKSFIPIEMYFKDTLNGDDAQGSRGFFSTAKTMARGNAHNDETWVIIFEKLVINNAKGVLN